MHHRVVAAGDGTGRSGDQMTRALLVHHDAATTLRRSYALREAGYEVETCLGPPRVACPVLEGRPCGKAERADVLVYDVDVEPDHAMFRRLVDQLRDLYADRPLVISTDELIGGIRGHAGPDGDEDPGRAAVERRGIERVAGIDLDDLALAIEEALGDR